MSENGFKIQAYNKKQLAGWYKISVYTFNEWIEPIRELLGEYKCKCFTPAQVQKIVDHLGTP